MPINTDVNTIFNLTIPKGLKTKLEILAKEDNRSTTNLIMTILIDFIILITLLFAFIMSL